MMTWKAVVVTPRLLEAEERPVAASSIDPSIALAFVWLFSNYDATCTLRRDDTTIIARSIATVLVCPNLTRQSSRA